MDSSSLITESAQHLIKLLKDKVFGQEKVIEEVVTTVLAQGHALLTGAPGVAKTMLVRNLASALGCGYKRIQFTPDLTPHDIIGGDTIFFDDKNPDIKRIGFVDGPVFSSFVLADEINRASPRTQSALLEAMQEKQVSVSGGTRKLPSPFFVFATQNPIENEGTFPLPEAQLDRFLLNIEVPYPDFDAELKIATMRSINEDLSPLSQCFHLYSASSLLDTFPISTSLIHGIVRLIRNTRPTESKLNMVKNYIEFGASPRASQALLICSKALALIRGDKVVEYEHVVKMAPAVLRHRCIINFKALAEKLGVNDIIHQLIQETVL